MSDVAPAGSIDEVLDLYDRFGDDHYDEALSQREHALQTAALGAAAGAADGLIAAALLHDVGHLLAIRDQQRPGAGAGDDRHEAVGAAYLRELFGPDVTAPVALHVLAKRYRCAVEPRYWNALSAGSQASLQQQGGPLDQQSAEAFAGRPRAAAALTLREWDDRGKVDGLVVAPLGHYRDLLLRVSRLAGPGPDR